MSDNAPTTRDIETALLRALGDIRDHWPTLLRMGGSSMAAGKGSPRSLYTREDADERGDDLPVVDQRIGLRHDVTLCLNGWARVIVEERDLTHRLPLGTDTLGLVELIERWARWFSGHEAAEDALAEMQDAARAVMATAVPRRREWVYLGDCPFVVEDWFCAGRVRAWPDDERLPSCSDCGQEAVVEWWEEVLDIAPLTWEQMPAFVSRTTGRTPTRRTLERWLKAGLIVSSGTDDKGRRIFDRGAVATALDTRTIGEWSGGDDAA